MVKGDKSRRWTGRRIAREGGDEGARRGREMREMRGLRR